MRWPGHREGKLQMEIGVAVIGGARVLFILLERWWKGEEAVANIVGIYFDHFISFRERRRSDVDMRRGRGGASGGSSSWRRIAASGMAWRGGAQDGGGSDC
jgi:hypothetical protein